eukprot:COSAG02_NODE_1735_length_11160_cov_4.125305_3_plen_143_part_00
MPRVSQNHDRSVTKTSSQPILILDVCQDSIHRRGQNHTNIKQNSGSGRSAESSAFISELYVLHKNPTQPDVSILAGRDVTFPKAERFISEEHPHFPYYCSKNKPRLLAVRAVPPIPSLKLSDRQRSLDYRSLTPRWSEWKRG